MFRVKVYPQPFKPNALVEQYDLTNNIEDLTFSTNAFGGFTTCTFTLKYNFDLLWVLLEDINKKGLLCRRVVIRDMQGKHVYEGIINNMVLDLGGHNFSRSLENMFTAVRLNHSAPTKGAPRQRTTDYNYTMVKRYGVKVFMDEDFDLWSQVNEAPAMDRVGRALIMFSYPPRVEPMRFGATAETVSMTVTALGVHSTLGWRYGWNSFTEKKVRSNLVVRQLLKASPAGTEPGVSARLAISSHDYYWHEYLRDVPANIGYIPWGQQFISTNFSQIYDSGIDVPGNISSGSTRLKIIQDIVKQGGVGSKRMLFQVWQPKPGSALGLAHFHPQITAVPFRAGYRGYYYSAKNDIIFNHRHQPIPFWQVRAGRWITVEDIVSTNTPKAQESIFTNPNCFWIEETTYNAQTRELSVSTTNDFDFKRLLSATLPARRKIIIT